MKFPKKYIFIFLILVFLSPYFIPSLLAVTLNSRTVFEQQGDGVALCLNDDSRCRVFGEDTSHGDLSVSTSPIEGSISAVAINKTGILILHEFKDGDRTNLAKQARIYLQYNEAIDALICRYKFVQGDNTLVEKDCDGEARKEDGFNGSAITRQTLSDGSPSYVLNLGGLCAVDSSGTGETCKTTWNDKPQAFSITGMATPSGATSDTILFCRNKDLHSCSSIRPGSASNEMPSNVENNLTWVAIKDTSTVILGTKYYRSRIQISYDKDNDNFLCYYDVGLDDGTVKARACFNGRDGENAISPPDQNNGYYVVDLTKMCFRSATNEAGTNCGVEDVPFIGHFDDWNDVPDNYFTSPVFIEITPFGVGGTNFVPAESLEQIPTNLAQKIADLYKNILGLAGVVALGILIFGGVLWSLSAGNPSRITEAKTWITSALVGLGLLFSAYLILTFINPDLTNLQEIFLDPNPTLVPGRLILPAGDFVCPVEGPYRPEVSASGSFWACRGETTDGNSLTGPGPYQSGCSASIGGRPHVGIDIGPAPSDNSPSLVAVESGIIAVKSINDGACGHGITLIGDNTGNVYRYCHMKTPTELDQGAHINAGDYIADMGTTGSSNAVHLHFGVRSQLPYSYEKHYDPCGFLQSICTASGKLTCLNREEYGSGPVPGFSASNN